MNINWRNRPTTIDEIPRNIDWIIAIDESGGSDLNYLIKTKEKGEFIDEGNKHFTVTACALRTSDFEDSREVVMNLKMKYWRDALFEYKNGKKRVCFHSKEIRGKNGPFSSNVINYNEFIEDLSNMMKALPITLISAHINKWTFVDQYIYAYEPYNLCMAFILERIVLNMCEGESCYIVIESRGKREDKFLLKTIIQIIDYGTKYVSKEKFSRIKGVYFNSKWSVRDREQKSYWELEIADLCSFPIHKYLSYDKGDKAFEILKTKIRGYPHIKGYGIKSFP